MADDIIASARAMTVVSENQYNTLGLDSGSLTPSTIMAAVGMVNNDAIEVNPMVTGTTSMLRRMAASISGSDPALSANINIALAKITSLQSNIGATNNLKFMSVIGQVNSHIKSAVDVQSAVNFIGNTSFAGLGVTNMSSLTNQGLDSLGDLGAVAKSMESVGPLYDIKNPGSIGDPGALVKNLMAKGGPAVNSMSNFNPANNPFAGLPSSSENTAAADAAKLIGG